MEGIDLRTYDQSTRMSIIAIDLLGLPSSWPLLDERLRATLSKHWPATSNIGVSISRTFGSQAAGPVFSMVGVSRPVSIREDVRCGLYGHQITILFIEQTFVRKHLPNLSSLGPACFTVS